MVIKWNECKDELVNSHNVKQIYVYNEDGKADKIYQCRNCGTNYVNDLQASCCCQE